MGAIQFIVAIAIVAGAWYLARPTVAFVIKYRNGVPVVVRGRLGDGFLASIKEICDQHAVTAGTITAVPHGKRIRLNFSQSIPHGCQQQIRNMILSGSTSDIRLSPPR